MSINLNTVQGHIEQLKQSERGTRTLTALNKLLSCDYTWSLDQLNQVAVTHLLAYALKDYQVREMINESTLSRPTATTTATEEKTQ